MRNLRVLKDGIYVYGVCVFFMLRKIEMYIEERPMFFFFKRKKKAACRNRLWLPTTRIRLVL